jgi:hypothetical protein
MSQRGAVPGLPSRLLKNPFHRHREAAKRPWRSRKAAQMLTVLDCFVALGAPRKDACRVVQQPARVAYRCRF